MRDVRLILILGVALAIVVGGGVLVPVLMDRLAPPAERPQAFALETPTEPPPPVPPDVEAFSKAMRAAAARVGPAVVAIGTSQSVDASATPFGFGDDFLRRFFGAEPQKPQPKPKRQFRQQGLGSGVIVSADGYILTSNHVVAGAEEITVRLADDREFDAKVIGNDQPTDVALIKIEATGLPVAALGDSDKMEVGDWVLAVGAPLGLQKTVTAGIISATGRANVGIADYEDFIQTDAAINPGNSGGPLVNLRGEVIGINTAIASRSGGYMGIGFAVPSNMARDVMNRLREKGEVVRGWLGVSIQNLSKELAGSMGLESAQGALVNEVFADGPAGKAGVKAGDVIVQYNGKPVKDVTELRTAVAWTEPGKKVDMIVLRGGKRETLSVQMERRGDQPQLARGRRGGGPGAPAEIKDLGIQVADLTPETAQLYGYEEGQGVLITDVDPAGLAAKAGMEPGMLILQVGGKPVRSVAQFQEALQGADSARGIPMLVRAGDRQLFVLLKKR
ncbi:MAG TPA: DegQ family serine endoprotease [Phycisphaerae bacterium]|nr:DegQ family serine endoprotease [Phycisphaerae bacterium]